MTYRPKPIDFCDHVGHGLCADCPDDPQTVDDVTIDIDGDTYARLAAAADAAGESIDDVAERAVCSGCVQNPCDGDVHARGGGWGADEDERAFMAWEPPKPLTVTRDELNCNPDLARRPGGVDIVRDGKVVCHVSIPGPEGVDVRDLREQLLYANRELERWRHGEQIEGDYVCPDSLALCEVRAALKGLIDAFPRLSSEFSTATQQAAVRAARAALGGGE